MNFLFAIATTIGMTFIPLLITDSLGLSLAILGLIEGSTEFISNVLRLVTGNLFDRIKNKRLLFILPATLAFISKLILFIPNVFTILAAKTIERIANGAFAAPRDAYIGENARNTGLALGILSFTKTSGCILGPVLVSATSVLIGPIKDNILIILFLACLVNFIGFGLSFIINTKKNLTLSQAKAEEFNFKEMKQSFKKLKPLFILSFLFFLGRFNDGMIMIHLKNEGFPEWFYLATISFFNIVMMIISPFMGYWIDKKKERSILLITIVGLFGFNMFFSKVAGISWFFASLGLICWGIQRAGAQITFISMIFKQTPVKYYGSAVGVFSLISGFGVFIASMISGRLAQLSFKYVFYLNGSLSFCTLLLAGYILYFKDQDNKV